MSIYLWKFPKEMSRIEVFGPRPNLLPDSLGRIVFTDETTVFQDLVLKKWRRLSKDDLCILNKPKIRGLKNAGVLAQMAVSVLLLKRIARFIVKVTLALRKMLGDIKLSRRPYIRGPDVPKVILNLIQRE